MNNLKKTLFSFIGIILFFLPIVQWKGFLYQSTFTKSIFFMIGVEAAFIIWMAFLPSVIRVYRKNHIVLGMLILYVIFALSSIFGVDVARSVWSDYERMLGLWMWGHLVVFFIVLVSLMNSVPVRLMLARILASSAALVAVVGVGEALISGGGSRVESTFANPSFLASYLFLSLFVVLWLALHERISKKESKVWLTLSGMTVLAIIFTGTRGTLAAFLLSGLIVSLLYLFYGPHKNKKVRSIIVVGLVAMTLLVSLAFVFRDQLAASNIHAIKRIGDISLSNRTLVARFLTWGVAWEGIQEHIWFGWGLENFHVLFSTHYNPELINQEPWFDRAHNFFFDITSTTGIFGLAAYIGLFGVAILNLVRAWKKGSTTFWTFTILATALIGHLVQNLLLFDILSSLVVLMFLFALIAVESKTDGSDIVHAKKSILYIVGATMIIIPVFVVGVWKPAQENYYGNLAFNAFAKGDDESGYELTEKALAYNTYGDVDVRRAIAEYTFEFLKQGGRRSREDLKTLIDYSIERMDENITDRPEDVKWYMYQGQLYSLGASLLGDEPLPGYAANAEEQFVKSLALSPGRPQIYAEIAQARKIQDDIPGMWDMIDRMKELIPDHPNVYYNEVVHAIDVGDTTREQTALEAIYTSGNEIDFVSIRDAYFRNLRYGDAISIQLDFIKNKEDVFSDADLATLYQTLAALYKEVGDVEEAREAALKVGELNPELLPQVQAFINTL